ncbi:MAG: ATP-binding protein [Bacteroidota bacterium]|nr:ATP-binding protein [Bacteroidota bacterium]
MNNSKKIFIILLCIVLLPAIFYSVYEISSLDETEEMLTQMYTRQLDAILYSVNQYVLDVTSSWASQIETELPSKNFDQFLRSNPSVQSIIVSDSLYKNIRTYPHQKEIIGYRSILKREQEKIGRLFQYRTIGYRKLEPVLLTDTSAIIIFVPTIGKNEIIGMVIHNSSFIQSVIGKKLSDVAQSEFILAVVRQSNKDIVYSTHSVQANNLSQLRKLWIFPDYALGIRLQGITIQEIAQKRYSRNLALIILLDVVLIAGAWFIYRTIKREMELVALKSDFVSNVSHELRTPLALIRMFAETLEMKRVPTEKKKQEYYGTILQETERLTRLVNNLLNFSRMESNTRKYQFHLADINAIVTSVMNVYAYQLKAQKFEVKIVTDDTLPQISMDEEAIAEALHNVIDNAIKYSGEKKYLRVATAHDTASIRIEIEDHGIGISQEHHHKIFEKFYRVSHGLVHTAKGSGLGLSLVRHIVDAHKGHITVQSSIGKGSTFIITLPKTTA